MPQYSWQDQHIKDLYDLLVTHIQVQRQIIKFVKLSGIPMNNINTQGAPSDIWFSVIDETMNLDLIPNLLKRLIKEGSYVRIVEFIQLHFEVETPPGIPLASPLGIPSPPADSPPAPVSFDMTPSSQTNKSLSDYFYMECDRVPQMQTLGTLINSEENKLNMVFIHGGHEDMHLYLIDRFLTENIRKENGKAIFPFRTVFDKKYVIEISEEGANNIRWDQKLAEYYNLSPQQQQTALKPDTIISHARQFGPDFLKAVIKVDYHQKGLTILKDFLEFWRKLEASSITIFLFICVVDHKKATTGTKPFDVFTNEAKALINESQLDSVVGFKYELIELDRFNKSLIKTFMANKKITPMITDIQVHQFLKAMYDGLADEVTMVEAIDFLDTVNSQISKHARN